MAYQETLEVATPGRGTIEITAEVQHIVNHSGIDCGVCQVFIRHTSAALIICENADPSVRTDLERFLSRLVPDGDPLFEHAQEGPDDMPAHIRSILSKMDLGIPVRKGRCALGTWQGIYLYEHRMRPHRREVVVTVLG